MPSILRREFAPISDEAWQEIDTQAADVLKRFLVGRRIADFSGPHGWEMAAVNLGRLEFPKGQAGKQGWGLRQVLPLVELRLPFTLQRWELDNLTRGAADADIDAAVDIAAKAAEIEDGAVFNGLKEAGITGLVGAAETKAVTLPADAEKYPATVSQAVRTMQDARIGGPYALVLGADPYWTLMQAAKHGYPPHQAVRDILGGGDILTTPVLGKGGVVVSSRGGDFELTVGKDLAIGYAKHDSETVEFFLTESFTFRVLEPKAVVPLKGGSR